MTRFQALFAAASAVVLFLYGLQSFSRELQTIGGTALQSWLKRATANRWRAFAVGAAATALIQSSSAVTSLAAALVDAGVISLRSSLGILPGATVGTTATAWLVSFKLTGIGPVFIVIGALLSALPVRAKVLGKALFYFGFIFFGLDLISSALKPLHQQPEVQEWLALAQTPWRGVLTGLVFAAIVQSSSVTAGVAILLVQQGILPLQGAIPIVIGATVGSTSTALIASLGMKPAARAMAVANVLVVAAGALVFFPFLGALAHAVSTLAGDPGVAVAWAQLIFNSTVAGLFLATIDWVEPRIQRRFVDGRPAS